MIHTNLLTSTILWYLLLSVPATLCSCSGEMPNESFNKSGHETDTELHFSGTCITSKGSIVDILTFEDDMIGSLDSYIRIEDFEGNQTCASSTGGNKIFFICVDGQRNRYNWTDVSTFSSLGKVNFDLEKESFKRTVKIGTCRLKAGTENGQVELEPLVSEIVLRSISCNFRGTPYENAVIEKTIVYLTNVNASCPIIHEETFRPMRYINTGMLNCYDMSRFIEPEILVQNVTERLDQNVIYPENRLLCYPNLCPENNPGNPETRLVIEGKIDSKTYYWPITINKGIGVERNCRYVYDICITRKGVTDPDIPIDPEKIELKMTVLPWKEIKGYSIGF